MDRPEVHLPAGRSRRCGSNCGISWLPVYADGFITLWKKNHYHLLQKARKKRDILSIIAERPVLHNGEDTRWDLIPILPEKVKLAGKQ